jgi:hypothetical protein
LLSEIKTVLKERGEEEAELEDKEWLFDLTFLSDFTGNLSDKNLELQGKSKCIAETISAFSSYRSKFELMMTDLTIFFITFLICCTIWENIPILFFIQRSKRPKSVLLSRISKIDSVTSRKLEQLLIELATS